MPPIRRKKVTPAAKGRHPRVAGTGSAHAETAQAETVPEATNATAVATPPATPAESAPADAAHPRRSGWRRVVTVGAAALTLGACALVSYREPGAEVSNPAWVDTASTAEATAAARSAIEKIYSYDYRTVDDNLAEAVDLLTEDMRRQLDPTTDTTRTAVVESKTTTEAQVTDIGVKLLSRDGDRAQLLAVMNVSTSADGVAQGSAVQPLAVDMEKIDGKWLVSGFTLR